MKCERKIGVYEEELGEREIRSKIFFIANLYNGKSLYGFGS